jgi:hypothetical protein
MKEFIHLRSARFPLLPGEAEEMVNEGLVGGTGRNPLPLRGLRLPPPQRGDRAAFCCTDGASAERIWNWRTFGWIDTAPWPEALHGELRAIFREDPEVELLGSGPTFP